MSHLELSKHLLSPWWWTCLLSLSYQQFDWGMLPLSSYYVEDSPKPRDDFYFQIFLSRNLLMHLSIRSTSSYTPVTHKYKIVLSDFKRRNYIQTNHAKSLHSGFQKFIKARPYCILSGLFTDIWALYLKAYSQGVGSCHSE